MLPRAAAAFWRASTASSFIVRPNIVRRVPQSTRPLSLWPFKGSKVPHDLPVYFPRPPPAPKSHAFRKRLGRVVFTTITLYVCFQIFATVVFDPLLDWADHEWDNLSDKEKREMEEMAGEEDDPLLFLPFPFTTKEVKQPPYKGSDPEWLAFLAVNKDQQVQKDIKFGLAEIIRRGVEKNPGYVRLLGGKDIKLKKLWLDIIYPPAPPPKHYVSGIIIDDEGIFWGDRPIDSVAASHVNMAIYPKAVALTVWTFVNSLCRQTAQDVAKALGFNTEPPQDTSWQTVAINRMKEQGALGSGGKHAVKVPSTTDKPANFPFPTANGDLFGPSIGSDNTQLDPRIQGALHAASMTFTKNWQPVKQPPSRGCIRVDGLVELQGKNAVMAVYVLGWYDPKQKNYMAIQTGLKHLIQLKQRPAAG
ncbi:uncharacterized protein G6M90_00g025190 [Metarhizium brunneum]|uniref:Uncharacterized protein n=2 Tax=Metarhizium TaxID=5529 RepID=A0A7D5UQ81_9HYPO|nr:hypothetical protein G6M90_00g025190 [Metarhizium brunneum]